MLQNSQDAKKAKHSTFSKVSETVSEIVGSPWWFIFSIVLVLIWALSGFVIGFGENWQLWINTTTTILTFLMMSLLHASQSKWEKKMERIQTKEKTALNAIKSETAQIVNASTTINTDKQNDTEKLSSLQ
ncbi:low affinity iron permease family protein [candidate division WWE3 bacterium]|uniref:Low affinity iron permease family protein n=1 Tax=candidate division WWE3 bacterium TaxID=2053526 RepID=A0A955ECT6_UNCKA|nr:low affinity iron permease family protein [candidate division WWE3 bacterium]